VHSGFRFDCFSVGHRTQKGGSKAARSEAEQAILNQVFANATVSRARDTLSDLSEPWHS
jgi:hypothetical protein